jgi:hypothetical protein
MDALIEEMRAERAARAAEQRALLDELAAARAEDRAARAAAEERAAALAVEIRAAIAANTATLVAVAAALQPLPPARGGGASPAVAASDGSHASSPSSRRAAVEVHRADLLAKFAAARLAGKTYAGAGLAVPCDAAALREAGVVFAHRLVRSGGLRHDDFDYLMIDNQVVLEPSPRGGKGLSFFVVLSDDAAVLHAAHVFRGALVQGCHMFSLEELPAALSLVVDKVQAGDLDAPVLLHASVAPRERMSASDFSVAMAAWRAAPAPCVLAGAGDCGGGGCGSGCGSDGARAPARDNAAADVTAETLAKVALRLTASAAASRLPAGGSPGQ